MPGVSSRRDVPGALGVGKIRLKFVPIASKKKSRHGAVLFLFCFFLIVFSICWSYPNIRYAYVVPLLQRSFTMFESMRRLRPLNVVNSNFNGDGKLKQTAPGKFSIEASNLQDGMFMQGFVHAHEHFFEMDLARRTAYGKLSSLYGESSLPKDKFAKALDIELWAEFKLLGCSDFEKEILTAYTNGVNEYVKSLRPINYPIEYWLQYGVRFLFEDLRIIEAWTTRDTIALMMWHFYHTTINWNDELAKWLLPANVREELFEEDSSLNKQEKAYWEDVYYDSGVRYGHANGASAWILRAASGAILSTDIHHRANSLFIPPVELAISFPGFNVTGVSYAGIPLIMHGQNEDASWSIIAPEGRQRTIQPIVLNGNKYTTIPGEENNNGSYPDGVFTASYSIEVMPRCPLWLFSASCKPYNESVTVQKAFHGPLISDLLGSSVGYLLMFNSLRDIEKEVLEPEMRYDAAFGDMFFDSFSIERLYRWNTMRGWNDCVQAADGVDSMSLMITYADRENNVGYVVTNSFYPSQTTCSSEDNTTDANKVCSTIPAYREKFVHLNPVPVDGAIVFDDLRKLSLDKQGTRPRSVELVSNLLSNETLNTNPTTLLEHLSHARVDTLSHSALFLKELILSLHVNAGDDEESQRQHHRHGSSTSHYFSDSADRVITQAQAMVKQFDGHLNSKYRLTPTYNNGINNASIYQTDDAIAVTVIEAFRLELVSAVLAGVPTGPVLIDTLRGNPLSYLNDNYNSLVAPILRLLYRQYHNESFESKVITSAGGLETVCRIALVKSMRRLDDLYGPFNHVTAEHNDKKRVVAPLQPHGKLSIVSPFVTYVSHTVVDAVVSVLHSWDWGYVHSLLMTRNVEVPIVGEYALAHGPYPLNGGSDTVLRGDYGYTPASRRGALEAGGYISYIRLTHSFDETGKRVADTVIPSTRLPWNNNDDNILVSAYKWWARFEDGMLTWLARMGHINSKSHTVDRTTNGNTNAYIRFQSDRSKESKSHTEL